MDLHVWYRQSGANNGEILQILTHGWIELTNYCVVSIIHIIFIQDMMKHFYGQLGHLLT